VALERGRGASVRAAVAILRLIRWPNALIAGAGVLVGAWWAGGDPFAAAPLLATACAVALAAVANAANDAVDRDIDRIAHPARPLPSGDLSVATAWRVVVAAAVAALLLAAAVGGPVLLATPIVLSVMLAYTPWLKPLGVPGNLAVAALASLPFLYGGWSVDRPGPTLALVALAVPLHLAREIAKDLDDAPGDAGARRTLPVAAGTRVARAALVVALGVFLGALGPFVAARPRLALLLIPAVALALLGAWRALRGRRGAPALLKASMVFAMASLLAAR
jgi:geranylgeranylglycerol-phosphate geranylgeranyltransferase